MNPALISVLIAHLPELVGLAQGWFATAHPGEPTPTSEEVLAAWMLASTHSLTIDDDWLSTH